MTESELTRITKRRAGRGRRSATGTGSGVAGSALVSLVGASIAWEIATRWIETVRAERGYEFWRIYADDESNRRADSIRQVHSIRSTGVDIHIDVYPRPEADAPVVIFNHGAAGYCRLFINLALRMWDRGYTVVLPDQRGQGFSGGVRGDQVVSENAQNVLDVARWAKAHFGTTLYMGGGSFGGALTYYAAAAGAPVRAIACLNLFDFGCVTDALGVTRLNFLREYTHLHSILPLSLPLVPLAGWLRVPFAWFGRFEHVMDARDSESQAAWIADPIPPRLVSLRALASFISTPPAVPFESNTLPVLVMNQGADQMVDPGITRHNYERLGGEKRYIEIHGFGHWSTQPAFWDAVVEASDTWFREHP